MSENNELGRLEEIIENLLNRYNKLEEENRQNLKTIEQKNSEIEELQGKLSHLDNEKDHIQKRISGILRSIEDWESREAGEPKEVTSLSKENLNTAEEEWPKLFGTDSNSVD